MIVFGSRGAMPAFESCKKIILFAVLFICIRFGFEFLFLLMMFMIIDVRVNHPTQRSTDVYELRRAWGVLAKVTLAATGLIVMVTAMMHFAFADLPDEDLNSYLQFIREYLLEFSFSPAGMEYLQVLGGAGHLEEGVTMFWAMNISSLVFLVFCVGSYDKMKVTCIETVKHDFSSLYSYRKWWSLIAGVALVGIFAAAADKHFNASDLNSELLPRKGVRVHDQHFDYYRMTVLYSLALITFVVPPAIILKILPSRKINRRTERAS